MKSPRLRFAPSPSGYLHIGGARTALYCRLLARRHGGSFLLRIEDTNAEKSSLESVSAILEGLRWLGIDWDEGPEVGGPVGPYFQSERRAIYQRVIDELLADGKVYRCDCSAEELQAKREAALVEGRRPVYDGTCRAKADGEVDPASAHVLRLRAPTEGETVVEDHIKGRVVFPNVELGDQIVVRTNGDPLYNFVVVVDDHEMGITHVVRGDDHLSNTPKQVQLYEALGWEVPEFAHVPLILGEDKKRLSKRHGATNVMSYADEGYLPEAVVNFLARIGWAHGDQEVFSAEELVAKFSLDGVGKSAGVWNPEKLLWLNGHYIANMPASDLAERVAPFIEREGLQVPPARGVLEQQVRTLQARAKTLVELVQTGRWYWTAVDDLDWDPKAKRKFLKPQTAPWIAAALEALEALPDWTEEAIEHTLTATTDAMGINLGKLAQPIRVAVTGTPRSPGIHETLAALGRETSLARIRHGLVLARVEVTEGP